MRALDDSRAAAGARPALASAFALPSSFCDIVMIMMTS